MKTLMHSAERVAEELTRLAEKWPDLSQREQRAISRAMGQVVLAKTRHVIHREN